MNVFVRLLALCFTVLAVSAEAKTAKYDIEGINAQSGFIHYPRLDLSSASSVVFTVTRNSPLFEPQLTSLEITFPEAAKLTVTNFKLVDNSKYRAIVSGAWIYKEIIVEVDRIPFDSRNPATVNAYISERTAFINPQVENHNPNGLLFSISGNLRDITPVRIVDNASVLFGGKKVTLSLRDRLQVNPAPWSGTQLPNGFVIDTLWYGKGTKTIYIDAPVPPPEYDAIEVIALVVGGISDLDRTVSVKYKDRSGTEITGPVLLLKDLLDQAYGPTFAPAP